MQIKRNCGSAFYLLDMEDQMILLLYPLQPIVLPCFTVVASKEIISKGACFVLNSGLSPGFQGVGALS